MDLKASNTNTITNQLSKNTVQQDTAPQFPVSFAARSISEEFSSGDAGRYRDSEEYAQSHTPSGRENRQDKMNKDKEDRDEGK